MPTSHGIIAKKWRRLQSRAFPAIKAGMRTQRRESLGYNQQRISMQAGQPFTSYFSNRQTIHPMPSPESAMSDPNSKPLNGNAEDSFFILRDCRILFQRRLAEIGRQAGIVSQPVIEAFTEALGEAHDRLAVSSQRDSFEQSHGLTASRITLMCDDDLELDIRIGEIGRTLLDVSGNALWRTHSRYITLLGRPEMAQADNPVGAEAICEGLWAICKSSGAGLEGNFTLLDRIEAQLAEHLATLYVELNALLSSRNVAAAQTQIIATGGARPANTTTSTTTLYGEANPLSALRNILNQQQGNTDGSASGATTGSNDSAAGNIVLNAATLVMLNQLAERLDQLALSGVGSNLSGIMPDATEQTVPRALRAKDLDLPLGKPEAIALDTLALIFEAIFETWELPDTVKTTIGRLQIPLLKLAIFDPTLFSDTAHPARRLINGMARAAAGLPRNVGRAHPVSMQLWQLAGTVCETLKGDASVLAKPLAELEALITQRDQEIIALAAPYIALLSQKTGTEQAMLAARSWLQLIEQAGAPQEIIDFLRQYWVHVMAKTRIEDGVAVEGGSHWSAADATIDDLLWSVQSKQNVDDRKQLASLVPSLLKRISTGLDRINAPEEARAAFLDSCFNLQTAALRGNPALPVTPLTSTSAALAPEPNTGTEPAIVIETLESDGKQLKIVAFPDQSAAAHGNPESIVQAGDWLQFSISENQPLCGLVCWLPTKSGNALLFNPEWPYAVDLAGAVMAQQLFKAQAKVVSSQAIFDTAAERALSRLSGT